MFNLLLPRRSVPTLFLAIIELTACATAPVPSRASSVPFQEPPTLSSRLTPMPVSATPDSVTLLPAPAPMLTHVVPGETRRAPQEQKAPYIVDMPRGSIVPESQPGRTYSAFDFLRDYMTNRSYATVIDGRAWTNSTVNFSEYQHELGGVTYWDFFSEPSSWDDPSYMWQDDEGNWRPYEKQVIRDSAGREIEAFLLLDRKGPGAMDKLWFTEDAVWMLTTEQSRQDAGPIESMEDFVEWGNLQKLGNLRIEVDDRIIYDGDLRDWLDGKAWGLTPELVRILTWRHREYGSSGNLLPVLYQKHLRVLLYGGSKKPKWFLATGVRFPDAIQVQTYTGSAAALPIGDMTRRAQNVLEPESYIDTLDDIRSLNLDIPAGGAAALQFPGAGTVTALQFRVAKRDDPRQLWFRVKYDNVLAVDLPLVAFFGDQQDIVLHRSTPLGVTENENDNVFYSNYPLPFQNGMTLELSTNGQTPLHVPTRLAVSGQTARTQLWVHYQPSEKLKTYGPNYVVTLPGDGKLVGLVLESKEQDLDKIPKLYMPGKGNMEDPVKRAWSMGYLEGNLTLTDGEGASRIYSGQEDWADAGFYFNRGYTSPPGGSNRPFGGILRYRDDEDGYATVFRYFNDLSAFRFKNGLSLSFGHGTWSNNFPVRYGTTSYYYREVNIAP